jgi:hypothetical protein
MQGLLTYVAAIACIAVAVILLVGIGGFGQGGAFNRKYANKIMQLRVAAQFVAVILIVALAYFMRQG